MTCSFAGTALCLPAQIRQISLHPISLNLQFLFPLPFQSLHPLCYWVRVCLGWDCCAGRASKATQQATARDHGKRAPRGNVEPFCCSASITFAYFGTDLSAHGKRIARGRRVYTPILANLRRAKANLNL